MILAAYLCVTVFTVVLFVLSWDHDAYCGCNDCLNTWERS